MKSTHLFSSRRPAFLAFLASLNLAFGWASAGPAAAQGLGSPSAADGTAQKKTTPNKAVPKPTASRKSDPQGANSRLEARSGARQAAAGAMPTEEALAPDELALAEQVQTGVLPCELGAFVKLEGDPGKPGYFNVSGKNFSFRMVPVVSTTGAIRLEDRHAGAVWLQLANKSMLMNQKAGRRMADECMSPTQASLAQLMKLNPGPSLLDRVSPAPQTNELPVERAP